MMDSSYYPGNTIRRPSRFPGLSPNLIISGFSAATGPSGLLLMNFSTQQHQILEGETYSVPRGKGL